MEKPTKDVLEGTRKPTGPTRGKDRAKIAELFADERCSLQALLDPPAITDVGRMLGPPVAEERVAVASDASEWGVGNARNGSQI